MSYAFEFDAQLQPGKPLNLPKDIAEKIPAGTRAHIIVKIDGEIPDRALQRASYDAFHKSYASEDDALYEVYRPR